MIDAFKAVGDTASQDRGEMSESEALYVEFLSCSLLKHVSFDKSILRDSHNCFDNSNNCVDPVVLWVLAG